MSSRRLRAMGAIWMLGAFSLPSHGQQTINDTLTGASSSFDWQSIGGACLTAGDNTGSIPACVGLPYYTSRNSVLVGGISGRLPDPVGSGALRLTNGDYGRGSNGNGQTGAVYSKFSFPANQGLQIIFKTATYGGNAFNGTGADGISFFLTSADQIKSVDANTRIGPFGGNLGYTCSNWTDQIPDGLLGAYIGLGIDEYGNFANAGAGTATGYGTPFVGFPPAINQNRITLRGGGNIVWSYLSTNSSTSKYYPSSLTETQRRVAVANTCRTATLWDSQNANSPTDTQIPVLSYPMIASSTLPGGIVIANQQATTYPTRTAATPITYGIKITQDGLLSLSFSINGGVDQVMISNQPITQSNGPLPSAFRFGFASSTGSGSNVHEIMCFKAAQSSVASSSGGQNVQQSSKVQIGTQLYLALYHPQNWWGQLSAQNLVLDPVTDVVSINPIANWDANCVLTGGQCAATNGSNTVQGPANRALMTWNGGAGVGLQWKNLTSAQKTALDSAAAGNASSARLDYLRGDRGNEIKTTGGGSYRLRNSVLGDIMNSSPTWVGAPSLPYTGTWKDALYPGSAPEPAMSYDSFASSNATRTNVVYIGANDGLLHGFRAGAYKADKTFNTAAPNDGRELMGYMPAAVLNTIHSNTPALDYSSTQYAHNAFVDATPGTGDLFYQGSWHTWLVGGLGAGGNATGVVGDKTSVTLGAFYALDVTNPDNASLPGATFSEANAGRIVIGEWNSNSSTLVCASDASSSPCRDSLGSVYGTPLIRRLHNGNWAVIFGNGLNSKSGKAGIFIMIVDSASGNRSFRFLDTGVGPTIRPNGDIAARNGIVQVTSADLDGDHITDYVYAGDVFGNLWRFDLTSKTDSAWAVRPTPLFSTGGLPITTSPSVTATPDSKGAPRVVVSFGTGQIFPQTLTSAAQPASTSTQQLFGIWDSDMSGWNSKSSAQYLSLAGSQTVSQGTLQSQTLTTVGYTGGSISGARTVTQNPVCWKGSSNCSGGNNTQFGWQLALTGAYEQIIFNPVIQDGMLLVNTTLPAINQPLSCDVQAASGFTMAILPDTGGAPPTSYFRGVAAANNGVIAGVGLSGVGSPSFVTGNKSKYLLTQTVKGDGAAAEVNPAANAEGERLTWIRLR